jgi:4-diphosphocytidyl-2-C-methyl-D-erythritol kinase
MILHERACAKVNLVLQVGAPRDDGLHPICSLFASIDLADELQGGPTDSGADSVDCPGVEGPNLAAHALDAFRERTGAALPPVGVRVTKRIPVAAGLAGGSADAAAVLRMANRIVGDPLDPAELRDLAATLGSDVPSQIEPRHALVQGVGEIVEPVELPKLAVVLLPDADGLPTAAVYAELDRRRGWRDHLDPDAIRALARRAAASAGPAPAGSAGLRSAASAPAAAPGSAAAILAVALENDLQAAALALRPELEDRLSALTQAGALGSLVSGSGPTCFGLFETRVAADQAAARLPGAIVAEFRQG